VLQPPHGRGLLLPAQRVQPTHGALHWMVDAAAGANLRAP
jgi:hypothetical protein